MSRREFSKISPAVWRSGRFASLDRDAMLLHLYFMTCEHQNSAGCYRLPDGYACADLGWELGNYSRFRDDLVEAGLISFDPATSEVFVHRWFKHNPPMNDKHAIGTRKIIDWIESDDIREKVEGEFEKADTLRRPKRQGSLAVGDDYSRLAQTKVMQRP